MNKKQIVQREKNLWTSFSKDGNMAMKKSLRFLLLLLLCALPVSLWAQDLNISGTVLDGQGEPVIGGNVVVKGTTIGTATDINGSYNIQAPADAVLVFSFLGMTSKEEAVDGRGRVDVTLGEDTKLLDEIVVTALGIKRDKKALGYAMEELKGESLVNSREPNITNALTGKVSGLQVIKASGTGASSKIVLRGNNSLTGSNQPLIVIDGVPINNFTSGEGDFYGNNGGTDYGNGLADVNPEDIESMSVLKGGSAAALYGSRAGNGVILITTKSGRQQEGLGITVNLGLNTQSLFLKPEMQDEFGQGAAGGPDPNSRMSWGPRIEGQTSAYDNIDNFFNTGVIYSESVTLQQTIKNTSVYTSVSRLDDKGMTPNVSLNKTSLLARATTNLGADNKWKLDAKANYINNQGKNRPVSGTNNANPFYSLYILPRSLDIRQFNNPSADENGKSIWYGNSSVEENPWWLTQHRYNEDTRNRLLGNMSLSYAFTDWLSAEIKAGTDYYTTTTTQKQDAGANNYTNGAYSEKSVTFYENNYSFLLTAMKDNLFSKLGGSASLGGNMMLQRENSMFTDVGELNIPGIFSINNGKDNLKVDYTTKPQKINSLYGSGQLNWDGYLFLDATLRNDWSSTMSKENRSFMYPSVSLSGVISDMIPNLGGSMPEWFSFAKVRASYAEVGNSLSPFQLYNTYKLEKDPNGNLTAQADRTLYDQNVVSELIKTQELGIDVRFFKNRLGIDFAWYKQNATNQLLNIPMDPSSGYDEKKMNAGNIQNQGWELVVNGRILENLNGFDWQATANVSANKSKIVALTPGVTQYPLTKHNLESVKIIAVEGGGYGDIYGYKFLRNEDGKIIVDGSGLPIRTEDMEYIGNQQPEWMMGITNTFSYKGFNFSFLIDGRFGGHIYSGTSSLLHQFGVAAGTVTGGNRAEFLVPNSVQVDGSENTTAVTPENYWSRIIEGGGGNLGLAEQFTYDATNVRLRTISLGYQFDKKMLAKTPFTKLGISISCNNVWMIYNNLPGIDPESVLGTDTNATGFELASAPTTRTFAFNINIGF